jgi:VanZ family protein
MKGWQPLVGYDSKSRSFQIAHTSGNRDRSTVLRVRILYAGTVAWLALTILWLTWTPLQFSGQPNRVFLFPGTTPLELIGNALLMTPIGVVLAIASRRPLAVVGGACMLLSLGVEFGQIFLLGRIVSVTDILLNTTGAVGAGWIARRLRPRLGAPAIVIATGVCVFAVVTSFTVLGGLLFEREVRIAQWDPEFPIVIGLEADGDKRFHGTVTEARICAGEERERVCAMAGAPAEARERLVEVAQRSQIVDVYARFVSSTVDQWGPTRIVTFSASSFNRNLTLAQEGSALVLRIRTPLMGPNGRNYEIWIPRAIRPGEPMEVQAHFKQGAVATTIRSRWGTRTEHHTFDALSSGLMIRGVGAVTPLQINGARLLSFVILLMPFGLAGLGAFHWVDGRNRRPVA